MKAKKVKSQSFLEYAVLIGVVVGVLIAMRVYMVRAVQERYRESADVFGSGEQYAKGVTQVTNSDEPGSGITEPPPNPHITCPQATASVSKLEGEIKTLADQAESMLESAKQTEAALPMLQAQVDALNTKAAQKEAQARDLRAQAAELIRQADEKQAQIEDYKKTYAYCYTYPDDTVCPSIFEEIARLESEIPPLRNQAESLNNQATGLENEAKDLRAQAKSLEGSILKLKEQISNLRAEADDFNKKINQKQAEIDRYKKDYPDCF